MSGSGARRIRAAVLAPAAALMLATGLALASGAAAQDAGPAVEAVPGAPMRLGPPVPLGPALRAGEPDAAIRSEPLAPPSPESAGLLTSGAGGLPEPLWDGTRRALVERLLPALPERSPSPTLRALGLRLLLTAGEPPRGEGPSLVALRVAKLAAMGATGDAAALADMASVGSGDPGLGDPGLDDSSLARIRIRAHLLAGTHQAVCDGVPDLPEREGLRLAAVCQAQDGRGDAALLTAGLLREAGGGDPAFLALVEAAVGSGAAPAGEFADPGPAHLALLRLAKLPVPAGMFDSGDPDLLAALASEPLADPVLRLEAAERAATLGLLDAGRLAAAYGAASADTARGAVAERLAAGVPPDERALLVAEATAGMPSQVLTGPVGAYWADMLAGTDVSPDALADVRAEFGNGGVAGRIARLLLAQDRGTEAAPWLDLLGAPDAAPLRPAAVAAGGSGLEAWLGHLPAADDAARRRAAGVLAILRAGGAAIPDEAWLAVLDTARVAREVPSPALVHWLRDAALAGAVGETVLVALALAGEDAPGGLEPTTVAAVVEALRAVGLGAEARRIAIEAVLPPET